jgi:hypothetical protein
MERARRDQRSQAAYWTRQGKFVVVVELEYYCRATDAYVGNYLAIRRICDDRKAAEIIVKGQPGEEYECPSWFVFELPAAAPAPEPVAQEDDDCPF